jgi:hypothetical protein
MGLASIKPDPRAAPTDMMLDAALQAATGLQQLLQFRGNVVSATTAAQRDAATARLQNAQTQLADAAEAIAGFFKLAEANAAAGRTGENDLN